MDRFQIVEGGGIDMAGSRTLWMTATTREWALRKLHALGKVGCEYTLIDTADWSVSVVRADESKGWE